MKVEDRGARGFFNKINKTHSLTLFKGVGGLRKVKGTFTLGFDLTLKSNFTFYFFAKGTFSNIFLLRTTVYRKKINHSGRAYRTKKKLKVYEH